MIRRQARRFETREKLQRARAGVRRKRDVDRSRPAELVADSACLDQHRPRSARPPSPRSSVAIRRSLAPRPAYLEPLRIDASRGEAVDRVRVTRGRRLEVGRMQRLRPDKGDRCVRGGIEPRVERVPLRRVREAQRRRGIQGNSQSRPGRSSCMREAHSNWSSRRSEPKELRLVFARPPPFPGRLGPEDSSRVTKVPCTSVFEDPESRG